MTAAEFLMVFAAASVATSILAETRPNVQRRAVSWPPFCFEVGPGVGWAVLALVLVIASKVVSHG